MAPARRLFAIKAEVADFGAARFVFLARKTMYGGKTVDVGDPLFVFASGMGGVGLIARGVVTARESLAKTAARQTPRVSVAIDRTGTNERPLGRVQLRAFRDGPGDAPEAELDFKLYRQATDKIVGLSDEAGAFLDALF